MAEYSERLPTASKSVLNLRLSTNLDAMSPSSGPAVPSACAPAPSAADGVRALYSTASMYGGLDTQRSCTTDTLGSKVSLWDLRCEVKTALDTSTGVAEVPIRADTLQRILDVMREHVHHRKTQRVLKKEAKVSHIVSVPSRVPPGTCSQLVHGHCRCFLMCTKARRMCPCRLRCQLCHADTVPR